MQGVLARRLSRSHTEKKNAWEIQEKEKPLLIYLRALQLTISRANFKAYTDRNLCVRPSALKKQLGVVTLQVNQSRQGSYVRGAVGEQAMGAGVCDESSSCYNYNNNYMCTASLSSSFPPL